MASRQVYPDDQRWQNPATPVELRPGEIGLMTAAEFLAYRNPGGKMHPSTAYDTTLESMNERWTLRQLGDIAYGGSLERAHDGGYVLSAGGKPVAVILDGVLYHERGWENAKQRVSFYDRRDQKFHEIPVVRREIVKYLRVPLARAVDPAAMNLERYPYLIRRIMVDGQPLEIRAEKKPITNKGTSLAIVTADGFVVAQAQDEWGATLFMVATEYRGKRLGQILGELWYELNPSYTSGGFTPAGERSALRIWERRVREFLTNGWYSDLVRSDQLTRQRVEAIVSGMRGTPAPAELPEPRAKAPPRKVLFMIDPGSYFVIYDAKALTADEVDESMIYAHGFFRGEERIGVFLYAIDYDPPFQVLATEVALQMARDEGEPLWVGRGYADLMELEGIEGVVRDGDYVHLDRDLLDLRTLGRAEKKERRKFDTYGEKNAAILEVANYKWRP